jgi:CheY-like chemotaxis protein
MSERVLLVDDEPQVLEGIQRALRKQVDLRTATGGTEGLRILQAEGPFTVVISDMRMPIMSGVEFLTRVRKEAPDAVRMILSGQSDLGATIAAVNEGHIYRFLCKPCTPEQLLASIADGIEQHRLRTMEKVLLEQTLSGAVKMLIEILGMISPAASGRAARLQQYSASISQALGLANRWEWGVAAYLSQLGCASLPGDILSKVETGEALSEEESRLYASHPEVAGKLLAAIPRLETVAAIVTAQHGPYVYPASATDLRQWDARSHGILMLRTAIQFDQLIARGITRASAIETLRGSKPPLPAQVLDALSKIAVLGPEKVIRKIHVKDLAPGMILDEDLSSPKGIRLVPAGHEVTSSLIVRLNSIASGVGIVEPFRVRVAQ